MSADTKISRADIIDAAFEIVRKGGWEQLSARSIAKKLKSSTMPIYSQFKTMEMLEDEVVKKAVALQAEYSSAPLTNVSALNNGIGYVLFAWEEPHLFAAINDEKHVSMQIPYGALLFEAQVEELTRNQKLAGLSRDQLRYFHFLTWMFVRGIATLKPWIEQTQSNVDKEWLTQLIRDGSRILTYGFIENQARSAEKKESYFDFFKNVTQYNNQQGEQ
ncbi:MAG: TetR/AcrR family transcriptional regulator [Smithellaceae bacterium]|nr:TetR/AcrR family transcriptional regulator [Smithellaceae bacterium]